MTRDNVEQDQDTVLPDDQAIGQLAAKYLIDIALPPQKIGFEAARLLDQLMAGEPAPAKPICLPPVGVISRWA